MFRQLVGFCVATFLVLVALSSYGQTREELAGTVDLLRHGWPSPVYVDEWVSYMGFEDAVSPTQRADAIVALTELETALGQGDQGQMLAALDEYLLSAPDALASMALYFYFNRVVDLEGGIPPVADLLAGLPDWGLLPGPNSKFFYSYALIDQAWQARAEGNAALESAYFAEVRRTARALMDDEPLAAVQVWNVYNYILASLALGEASVADALAHLKALVASEDPSVLTWIARYQLHTIPTYFAGIPNAEEDHFAVIASLWESEFMTDAFNDPRVMLDVKAMLELDNANVMATRQSKEAGAAAYAAIAAAYPDRLEWLPRKTGRIVANPSEYGVISMCDNNRTLALLDVHKADSTEYIARLQEFVAAHPDSEYADDMLWKLGRHCEYTKDLAGAREAYRQLSEDRKYSRHNGKATERLAEIDARLSASP